MGKKEKRKNETFKKSLKQGAGWTVGALIVTSIFAAVFLTISIILGIQLRQVLGV